MYNMPKILVDGIRDYFGESKQLRDRLKALGLKQTNLTAECEDRGRNIPYREVNAAFRSTSLVSDETFEMIETTLSELEQEYRDTGKPFIVKKKPSGRNLVIEDAQRPLPPGENAKRVSFIAQLAALPPVDKRDLDGLYKRLGEYLEICVKNDMKVGNQACYFALGLSRDDCWDWMHGKGLGTNPAYSAFAKKVTQICATYREGLMQDSKVNPVTGIFWQKNYDGLRDQQEVVLTPNNPLGQGTDVATLAERYKALPEGKE